MNVLISISTLQVAYAFKYIPEDDSTSYSYKNGAQKHIATAEDIPHHVLIVYGSFFCSGALIRSQIVVTTASCFVQLHQQYIYVKVGVDTITSHGQIILVQELKIHEYYKHVSAANNDIALLILEHSVIFNAGVKKAILVDSEVALRNGITIIVSGWGHANSSPKYSNNLIWSEMVVMNQADCKSHYKSLITSSSFCAKYQYERRLNDNGGAAMYRNLLVGLLSFGANNKKEPHVAVFTNASYFHRWISLNCQRLIEKYCQEPVTIPSDEVYSNET